ncbi:ataxin-7-like protein 1 [Conger conger]|uniref:ataxin-7-like protein 1 n=1 Tax=Conger conger TaxID=82655 RepID=UPI002A59D4D0|nr:ataxin-7-like protein 1 [Conger conger]
MATLDRKVPSPNTFLYKPWSAFVDAVKLQNSDIAHVEDTGKDFGNGREARKLSREDMPLYGQYPAHDQLCLVVCNTCSLVVKPQSFLSHYERRHAPSCEPRPPRVSHSSPLQPRPCGRAPLSVYPPKGPRGKPCVSVPVVSLEKMWCLGRGEGPHVRISCPPTSSSSSSSSPGSVRPPHRPQDRQLNGRGPPTPLPSPSPSPSALDKRPSPSPTSLDRRPTPTPSPSSSLDRQPPAPPPPLDRKHQNGTKPYKRVSGRVFDPNKHCGVLDPEGRKPCTRSLTCKTHSLTHRRAVPGRVKQFDSLLAEHKGRHLREQQGSHTHPSRPGQSQEPSSSSSSAVTDGHEARSTSLLKSRLANAHIPRVPAGWSSVAQSPCVGPPPDSVAPGPGAEGVSSEEGEVEPPEDLDCPCSSHHPRPMGCCVFGGRLMGRGYYVFDRRRDRLRLALHCMVEKHVSTHMWRKIPLAAESRTPHSGAPLAPPPLAPPSSLPPPLLPSPAPPTPSNSVSMVTYSTAFPHVGATGGVFSIVDSASLLPPVPALAPLYPSPPRQPRPRPAKSPKACDLPPRGGWAVGEVTGSKRRKSPLSSSSSSSSSSSFTGPLRGNCHAPLPPPSPHQPSPAISSNGTAPLCAKAPPPGHALPRPLPFSGDHALFARADGRKRKSSSPAGRPGNTPKPAPLNTIYRPPGSEPPHPTLPRQPKVHH